MWRQLQFPCPSAGPAVSGSSSSASLNLPTQVQATPEREHAPDSTAALVMEKECSCGDITVRISGEDLGDGVARGHVCFCKLCRISTGSHYAHSVEIPLGEGRLAIEGTPDGQLTTHVAPGLLPGSISRRFFCARCGTIIGGTAGHAPRVFMVRCGGFAHVPPPKVQFLAAQMVDWLKDKITDVPDGDDMETWRVVSNHLDVESEDTRDEEQDEKKDALDYL